MWVGWDRGIKREKGIYGTAWGGIQGYTMRKVHDVGPRSVLSGPSPDNNTRAG